MKNKKHPTTQEKKNKAIEFMKQLNIYAPYIQDFQENDNIYFYENFGGYLVSEESEIESKIHQIEERYNCKVYAITHEFANFGELYNFLVVTNYIEEWDDLLFGNGNKHSAFAYVWNKTDNDCSEFGSVLLQSFGGGIRRIA
jgi:hypothetical protein